MRCGTLSPRGIAKIKYVIGGSNRVNRGGSWNNSAANCRTANRNNWNPGNRNNNVGFRLARSSNKGRRSI